MAFTGTLDKCKACDKTVYFVDLLSTDGQTFHKSCFKCTHCKGTLVMSNYSSMDGVLYCKTHFEQLFKESGNFSKNFQTGAKPDKENPVSKTPNKLSALFSGTQEKCAACGKTVYPFEKVIMEGESYHKPCFKCAHGGCPLTHSSYASLDGILYCKHHFSQLFMEKGNYQHVLKAATHHHHNKKNGLPSEQPTDQEYSDEGINSPTPTPTPTPNPNPNPNSADHQIDSSIKNPAEEEEEEKEEKGRETQPES